MKNDSLVRIRVMHTCSVTISSVLYNGFIDRLANLHSVSLWYLDTFPTDSIDFSEQLCSGIYMCVVQFGPC